MENMFFVVSENELLKWSVEFGGKQNQVSHSVCGTEVYKLRFLPHKTFNFWLFKSILNPGLFTVSYRHSERQQTET